MKKNLLFIVSALLLTIAFAHADQAFTIDDYNKSLVKFGVPFYQQYPASFYTGFAPRVEEPSRIHFRAGRGNHVRLTALLDEHTVLTYLYHLKKRYDVYGAAMDRGMFVTQSSEQLDAYRRIIESPAYDILGTIKDFEAKKISPEQFYQASLKTLMALNPHRVFPIELDLKRALQDWKGKIKAYAQKYEGDPDDMETLKRFLLNLDDTLVLTNQMLAGRVNAVYLTDEQNDQLAVIISHILKQTDDTALLKMALDYFKSVTAGRYDFSTVDGRKFVPALRCEDAAEDCRLAYPEFTGIYPNGSVFGSTKDRSGNQIHMIRNSALMTFLDRPYHDVDHIRKEGYYGYVPKMDWQGIGNGIHNPGVSHHLPSMKHLYAELDIPEQYQFVWAVSRGPVSHGCVRLPVGHLWEVRHIFPASPEKLKSVLYFGNHSADYDVFDIDGNGGAEVMGTQYYIAYSVKGASGDARRRGKNFSATNIDKKEFYTNLYGAQDQFVIEGDTYIFADPYVSYFRKAEPENKQGEVISRQLQGRFPLYEQPYEQDKVQIYRLPEQFQKQLAIKDNNKSVGKQMVRVFGRINGCGPFKAEWSECYENRFDQEFQALLEKL
ncbi:MAG: hypothetical protein QNI89_06200 [Desulfobacterales bacterium]|nr:hypothetical protein [Desulfobacterales bacterium]